MVSVKITGGITKTVRVLFGILISVVLLAAGTAFITLMAGLSYKKDGWLATVTNLDGVSRWAITFASLRRNVREPIASAEDCPNDAEGTLTISWTVSRPLGAGHRH